MPSLLMGYPVVINDNMPTQADGSYSVAFGDFSTYQIAERSGLHLIRDVFTSKGSTIFHVTRRIGGALNTPDGLGLLKFSV